MYILEIGDSVANKFLASCSLPRPLSVLLAHIRKPARSRLAQESLSVAYRSERKAARLEIASIGEKC
jgi:hypothetical protein